MRRPDAAAGGSAGQRQPSVRARARACTGTMKQADGDQARQQADDACKQDKPPVVFAVQTIKDTEHRTANSIVASDQIAIKSFISR